MPIRIPEIAERQRVTNHPHLASPKNALYGCFVLIRPRGIKLNVIVSNGVDTPTLAPDGSTIIWEHVSVSVASKPPRCPTWEEMEFVRHTFWEPEDTVLQFHPPASQKVDLHQFTLHMWRGIGLNIFLPPQSFV